MPKLPLVPSFAAILSRLLLLLSFVDVFWLVDCGGLNKKGSTFTASGRRQTRHAHIKAVYVSIVDHITTSTLVPEYLLASVDNGTTESGD